MDLKICGVCEPDDLRYCSDLGVPYVGLNLIERSPRYLSLDDATKLWSTASVDVTLRCKPVLIAEPMSPAAAKRLSLMWSNAFGSLPILQIHMSSPKSISVPFRELFAEIWFASSVTSSQDVEHLQALGGDLTLYDGPSPGSGAGFDWSLIVKKPAQGRWGLAGGINPSNILNAVSLRPHLIDISSGVERVFRKKDHAKIKMIWDNVRHR